MAKFLKKASSWKDNAASIRFIHPNLFQGVLTHCEDDVEKDVEEKTNETDSTEDHGDPALEILKEETEINEANEVKTKKSDVINKLQLDSGEAITAIAISNQGDKFAYATLKQKDGCPLFIVNVTNEREQQFDVQTVYHKNFVSGISFSGDGLELAACDRNGTITIYEAATGACLGTQTFQDSELLSISYLKTKEERYLAGGTAHQKVLTFKVTLGKKASVPKKQNPMGIADDEEEKESDMELKFDGLFKGNRQIHHNGKVTGVVLMKDARPKKNGIVLAVTGSGKSLSIYVITSGDDEQAGKRIYSVELPMRAVSLSSTDDGTMLAIGCEKKAIVLEHKIWTVFHDGHGVDGLKTLKKLITPACCKKRENKEKRTTLDDWEQACAIETEDEVTSTSLSSDGKRLIIGSNDKTTKLYDVETAAQIHQYTRSGRVSSVALDSSGNFALVGAFDNKIIRYNVMEGLSPTCVISTKKNVDVQSVDISGNGLFALTCSKGEVNVFNLAEGAKVASFTRRDAKGAAAVVYCGELSFEGDYALAGGYDNKVVMYDVAKKAEVLTIKKGFFIWGLAIRHMNFIEGQGQAPMKIKDVPPDTPFLQVAIGSWDKTAAIHEIKKKSDGTFSDTITACFRQEDRVYSTSLSADGNILAVGTRDYKAIVYDLSPELTKWKDTFLAKNKDNEFVNKEKWDEYANERTIKLWIRPERVYSVCVGSHANLLAVSDLEKVLTVYDLHTRKERNSWKRGGIIHDVEFCLEDTILAAGGEDNKIVLYDIPNERILLEVPLHGICWDLGISVHSSAFICAEGTRAVVFGEAKHGFGMQDRPAFAMANLLLSKQDSLKIAIKSHPTLLNAVQGSTAKTLLQLAVEKNDISTASLLLSGDIQLALLADEKGNTALTVAAVHRKKQMLQLIFDAIISKDIVNCPATFKPLWSLVQDLGRRNDNKYTNKNLFEFIGDNFPDLLLSFLTEFEIEKCEDTVLGSLTQAPIRRPLYLGLPRRSPREVWKKLLKAEKKATKIGGNDDDDGDIELAVEAYRLPFQGIMQKFKSSAKDEHDKKEGNDENEDVKVPHFRNQSPLKVIVDASSRMQDYNVFKEGTIATTIIDFKWQTVRKHFLLQSIAYCVYLSAICIFSNAIANTSYAALGENLSFSELWSNDLDNTWGKIGLIFVFPVMFASCVYMWYENREFQHEALEVVGGENFLRMFFTMLTGYLSSYWNFIDMNLFALELIACILFVTRTSGAREIASIAVILGFFKFLYFCRLWDKFGPLVRMIYRTIVAMVPFLGVMVVLLLGYAMVFKVLEVDNDYFRTYPLSFIQTSLMIYGEFGGLEDHLEEPQEHVLTIVMFELMLLLVVIVLLNLLIAIMSDAYAEVKQNASLEYRLELANIILEIEKSKAFAWTDARLYPSWVHILKPIASLQTEFKTDHHLLSEQIYATCKENQKRLLAVEEGLRDTTEETIIIKKNLKKINIESS
mmetsp:Transcript_36464/g.46802  ORF Transcript_36464/g.46802 Transcript_36464/m.46802 type:complete len:1470 (-) Transcript_36464:220-4629(-)